MKATTAADYNERIVRVLVYVQQHLDEPLETDELARVACFSPFHFHRIFRAMAGEPIQEHVRRLRLERAALRLKVQEQSVTEAALDAGYETHEAFTRAFHTMFGMSPSEFRESHHARESPSGVHLGDTSGFHPPRFDAPVVEVRRLEPQRVVFVRHRGPYAELSSTWMRLSMWAGMKGLIGPSSKFLGISWDDPQITPVDKLRYDAAISVDRPVQAEGDVGVTEIAGGDYATLLHKGPYQELGRTYSAALAGWLPASGRELRDVPCFEHYLNNPQSATLDSLLTVVHIPV